MTKFQLHGNSDEQVLSVSLENILNHFKPEFEKLHWKLIWLDVVTKKSLGLNITDIENFINTSENGIDISFSLLLSLAREIYQGMEIFIIADSNLSVLKRYKKDEEYCKNCMVTLELVDSGFWEICFNNNELKKRINDFGGEIIILQ